MSQSSFTAAEVLEEAVSRYPGLRDLTTAQFTRIYVRPVRAAMATRRASGPRSSGSEQGPAGRQNVDSQAEGPSPLLDRAIREARRHRDVSPDAPQQKPAQERPPVPSEAAPKTEGADARRGVRTLFLRFALEMAYAEDNQELVDLFSRIDRYADEVLEAAGAS